MKRPERLTHRVTTSPDDGLSTFLSVRPRLFGIAYRMLGSAADAEDIVQDVWVRWQTTDRSVVRDAAAFLATMTTRLAINVMQSARSRRETYVGPWLPEPVDTSADPGLGAERGEALELGVLDIAGKAIARGASRVHPSRGVRLCIPRHRGHPSTPRSQRAATRDPRPTACGQWSEKARQCDRAETSSRGVHCRGQEWRRRRPRRSSHLFLETLSRRVVTNQDVARSWRVHARNNESDQHGKGHRS